MHSDKLFYLEKSIVCMSNTKSDYSYKDIFQMQKDIYCDYLVIRGYEARKWMYGPIGSSQWFVIRFFILNQISWSYIVTINLQVFMYSIFINYRVVLSRCSTFAKKILHKTKIKHIHMCVRQWKPGTFCNYNLFKSCDLLD